MPHINKIPIDELLEDLCHSAFEMGVAKVGLMAITDNDDVTKQLQSRYDNNQRMVNIIRNEITRRISK